MLTDIISLLVQKVKDRTARVSVLGLGRVGLPTALIFSSAGFCVFGIDTDATKVERLSQGRCDIQEPGLYEILTNSQRSHRFQVTTRYDPILETDFVVLCVPTPVHETKPNLESLQSAMAAVKSHAHRGMVMVIESTVPPSTTSGRIVPQLEELGFVMDQDIFVAYCPERLSPAHALKEFAENPRLVGGIGPNSTKLAAALLRTVCKEVLSTDVLTAEVAKLAENTFRDVNIAYANFLALVTEHFGGDVSKVIAMANTHPRVRIHRPGVGVGGPCLTKDPYLLTDGIAEELTELVRVCRRLNDEMPNRLTIRLARLLRDNGISTDSAKIAVLGVSYKPDIDDTSSTPAKQIIENLLKLGVRVCAYDPHTSQTYGADRAQSVEESLRGADAIVLVTAHSSFKSISFETMRSLAKPHCILFDGARVLDPSKAIQAGMMYCGTGFGPVTEPRRYLHEQEHERKPR